MHNLRHTKLPEADILEHSTIILFPNGFVHHGWYKLRESLRSLLNVTECLFDQILVIVESIRISLSRCDFETEKRSRAYAGMAPVITNVFIFPVD